MVNSDWLAPLDCDESLSIIKELALAHALKGGKQGECIASCITSGDLSALCNYSLDYEASTTWELSNCRQALAYYSKLEFIDIGVDREKAAVKAFWEAEALCRETNECFRLYESGSFCIEPDVSAVLHSAARKISRVLGDVPTFSDLAYRFGPGATTLTKKRDASVVGKLHDGISCSEELLPYASRILEELPHLSDLHTTSSRSDEDGTVVNSVSIVITNDVVNFVPKNAKTFRSVTVGGSLNVMVQLALGDHMSKRLAAFGIDLRDQSINQEWAQVGSIDGSMATLDLSMASDTISTGLVSHLLPLDWVIALDACRSSKVELHGKTVVLEKFSSMGNGYTFPLESLIFWALASSCSSDGYASVYGDDIIVETEAVPLVKRVLRACGFKLNIEKSYWAGSFRESCGADYHKGIDIRPYYQKSLVSGSELFKLHNFYVRRKEHMMALRVKAYLHPDLCIYGPDNYGDGHLLGDWKPRFHKKRKHGYGGVIFDSFKHVARRDKRACRRGDEILPHYSIYRRETGDRFDEGVGTQKGLIAFLRINRFAVQRFTPNDIPERVSIVDGRVFKTPTYPGIDGYKKISIYMLSL